MKKIITLSFIVACTTQLFAQNVSIPDANFKAYLLGNTSINTISDTEITTAEAAAFNGIMNCSGLGITDLTGIEAFTGSFTLDCSGNQISTLNLSANTGLYNILQLDGNPLTSITFPTTNNTILLKCANTLLTTIDVSSMHGLTHIWAMNNRFTNINLTNNTTLVGLNLCQNGASVNPFTTLNLTGLTNLQWLVINNSFLESLDVSPCTALISLDVSSNDNLISLNVKNGHNMSFGPGDFDATNCPNLTCVQVDNVMFSNTAWSSGVDAGVVFSTDCNAVASLATSMTIQGQGGATTITTQGGTLQMEKTILPSLAATQSINWGILSGSQYASINSSGLLTALDNGTVTVVAITTDGSNISATKNIAINNQVAGLSENNLTKITIYPNPASSEINIESDENIVKVVITDLAGKQITSTTNSKIDIQTFETGIYTIEIETIKGVSNRKFVKN